jgi:ankyrin repeat protein
MNEQLRIDDFINRMVAGVPVAQLETEFHDLDVNVIGMQGRTPLMVAAAEGLLDAMKGLVRSGAPVLTTGRLQMTALHEASANGQVTAASYSLSLGADVDAQTIDGVTPLLCVAAWGFMEALGAGGPANGWLYRIDRYVGASDVGTWCTYCGKSNDFAAIGMLQDDCAPKFGDPLWSLSAKPIGERIFGGRSPQYPFDHLVSAWRDGLLQNYE